jgi:hypothetical protein
MAPFSCSLSLTGSLLEPLNAFNCGCNCEFAARRRGSNDQHDENEITQSSMAGASQLEAATPASERSYLALHCILASELQARPAATRGEPELR